MKFIKLRKDKNKVLKVKAGFSWDNIGRVVDCEGDEYTISRVGDSKLKVVGGGTSHTLPTRLALSFLDIYDKQGKKINDMKDYE